MEWIAKLLATPATVIYLIAALAIIAFVSTLVFRAIVRRSKLPLSLAIKIVEEARSKEEFSSRYDDIVERVSQAFEGNRGLNQQWTKFQSQLTRNEEGIICTYFQPEEFFNSSVLLRSRWLPLCKAVPSYLVGIGLVFTFLGIAVVIYRASLALGSSNDLQALRDLLGAASLKFWTSLVGVALSVVTSGYIRHLTARYNVTTADFCHALSMKVFFLSQEYSLHLSSALQTQQLNAIFELKTLVSQSGKETAAEIVGELKQFRDGMTSVTENTFSDLVEKSTSELSNAIASSLHGVAQTFVSINEDLKRIVEQVHPLPDHFRTVSEQVSRASTDMVGQFDGAGRHLNDDLAKAKLASSEIASKFLTSAEHAENIRLALIAIPETVSKVTESLDRLGQLQDVSQRLHEAAAAVRSSSDALLVNWKQQAEHVSSVDIKLGNTVATLPSVFTQYSESLKKFSDEFESHLGRILGSLANQVESLEASQDSLRSIVDNLHAISVGTQSNRTAETL